MNYYKKILPRENNRRLEKLVEFRGMVIDYFNSSRFDWMADGRIESPEAQDTRVKINRVMDEVHNIVLCAGILPSIRYTPPPVVGGRIHDVDLVHNIFNLDGFHIESNILLDFIDRTIGIYENNKRPAFLRAINPFFYIGIIFDWVARLPFMLIGRAGFNRKKAEDSLIGRMFKGGIYIITSLASLLTVLHLLGYLEPVKGVVKGVFRSN